MRVKKKKIKKVVKIFLIIMAIFVIGVCIFRFAIRFKSDSKIEINVGENYNYKMKATFFSKDISNKLEKEGKVDNSKIGKYRIVYSYKTFLGLKRKKTVTVSVVDKLSPTIELIGNNNLELFLDDEYIEPGYSANDNYDKNVKVSVKGEVDTKTVGTYYLTYVATDSSGNTAEVVRKVIVKEKPPVDVPIAEFDIHNYFDSNVILGETEDSGNEYISKIVFVGDSVPWQFGLQGQWDSKMSMLRLAQDHQIYIRKKLIGRIN